jgi:hypothetical protein
VFGTIVLDVHRHKCYDLCVCLKLQKNTSAPVYYIIPHYCLEYARNIRKSEKTELFATTSERELTRASEHELLVRVDG